jgi:hypothetical protein
MTAAMNDFSILGDRIERAWRAAAYDSETFPEIARQLLAASELHNTVTCETILRWLVTCPQIPGQPVDMTFGDPPVRVYNGRRFYIEILCWNEGTTAIHQHSFSGAFQVLAGGSVHTSYAFEQRERIGQDLVLGDLRAHDSELLGPGDLQLIKPGNRLIHSLFHLGRPSITLVARTKHEGNRGPQYTYLKPGLGYDPFMPEDRIPRILRLLDALEARAPETVSLVMDLVSSADLATVVSLLLRWFRVNSITGDVRDTLLEVVSRRHANLAKVLRPALEEARRQALVIARRRRYHHPQHRFFLALLLNVGTRAQILNLVKKQYPDMDPIENIVSWTKAIVSSSRVAEGGGGALQEYDLGESELSIFGDLLREKTLEQILASLRMQYEGVDDRSSEVARVCESLKTSALFKPLFQR